MITISVYDVNITAWLTWLILTLGLTTFVTKSAWFGWFRTMLLERWDSYAGYCGGCVGFWVGFTTATQFPLHTSHTFLQVVLSALLAMLLGFPLASGYVEIKEVGDGS